MLNLAQWSAQVTTAARDRDQGVRRVCELCAETLDVTGVSASVTSAAGARTTLHATDARASLIEELQLTLGEGPCMDAVSTGSSVLVPDLNAPADLAVVRWSTFLAQAGEVGIGAVFAFPLRVGAVRLGAIDTYRDSPGPLSRDEMTAFWVAADAITGHLLTGASSATDLPAGEFGRNYELEVHQATGMVQVQLDVTTSEALLRLRARAYAEGRALAEVARDVVSRRLRFNPEEEA